ncbi:MAG TPA: putative toxin-antitoxin system toxin component, PIN family [Methylomusa anaerophila]|uniref:PIN domain-containing protein n=1 Tax=Methylomusa anaerophila TaxID=1930071 RepID=A0A348ANK4_9FIRM|nr:putative toxin-antitoxin system toxin component, PIN family [Methylomusa anaerophila]BBB92652.1 hypothetical protein MAMMFC1_03347 [Methylomusa anaerophila]HML87495.1 putative toxin-antitoxin system toxin component, PIN family [Methylomusa anaerophila]
MGEKSNGLRVFVDSNILISAMHSTESLSRKLLLLVVEEHNLLICSYTISEVSHVIKKRFPNKFAEWERFLSLLEFELVYTPENPLTFPVPHIRDKKDIPILISAILAEPDALVTGDYDFHTDEIKEYFAVYTPAEFLRTFGGLA